MQTIKFLKYPTWLVIVAGIYYQNWKTYIPTCYETMINLWLGYLLAIINFSIIMAACQTTMLWEQVFLRKKFFRQWASTSKHGCFQVVPVRVSAQKGRTKAHWYLSKLFISAVMPHTQFRKKGYVYFKVLFSLHLEVFAPGCLFTRKCNQLKAAP